MLPYSLWNSAGLGPSLKWRGAASASWCCQWCYVAARQLMMTSVAWTSFCGNRMYIFPVVQLSGDGVLFSIDSFVCLYLCLFLSFFVCFFVSKITRKQLDRFAWNFQGRCGVTMGRPDYIYGQFRETARCRDAQHGDGVCCAFAPQHVFFSQINSRRSILALYELPNYYNVYVCVAWCYRADVILSAL